MSLLAPLFLLGAIAVALPILFHLIRRSSREKVRFSSLMFLFPSPPRITRRSRLEHILLLLLRCAVICLLALAFARPFLQRQFFDPPADPSGGRTIVLLDTSASMRRGNLWAAATDRVIALLKEALLGELAILSFDQTVKPVITFEEWNRTQLDERAATARERIWALKPTWGAGHLDLAFIQAAEEFEASERPGPRQIIVVSDLQEGSHLERLQSYEWPKNIQVRLEAIKAAPGNAGLHFVSERDTALPVSPVPRVRVTNSRDSKVEHFEIRWEGERVTSDAPIKAYVPAGQTRVFQAPRPTNSSASTLILAGDAIDFDNRAYRSDPLPTDAGVLFLAADAPSDPTKPLYYVHRALQQTQRQRIHLLSGEAAMRQLAATNEARLDLLAIITSDLSIEAARQLTAWIHPGKTALFVLSKPSMAKSVEQVVGVGIPIEEASAATYAMLGQIDFEHPIFAPFSDPRYSDFTKIHFWKHRRISADNLPQSRVLARFDDGSSALLEAPLGEGRILILSSGWDPAESQLALSSKFVPLLYSILEYSGAPKPSTAQFLVGDSVPLASPMSSRQNKCSVRAPDGRIVEANYGEAFTATDLPGIYAVTSLQATQQFAVNVSPSESRTAPLPPEELQRLGVPLSNTFKPDAGRAEQKRRELHHLELENRQKLWRWLIIGVLVLLVVETWFAARLTRRASMQEIPA
jgi:hypothetical protein